MHSARVGMAGRRHTAVCERVCVLCVRASVHVYVCVRLRREERDEESEGVERLGLPVMCRLQWSADGGEDQVSLEQ